MLPNVALSRSLNTRSGFRYVVFVAPSDLHLVGLAGGRHIAVHGVVNRRHRRHRRHISESLVCVLLLLYTFIYKS